MVQWAYRLQRSCHQLAESALPVCYAQGAGAVPCLCVRHMQSLKELSRETQLSATFPFLIPVPLPPSIPNLLPVLLPVPICLHLPSLLVPLSLPRPSFSLTDYITRATSTTKSNAVGNILSPP